MRPESKCVFLDTAKKLNKAGWKSDTERWWVELLVENVRSEECYTRNLGWELYPGKGMEKWMFMAQINPMPLGWKFGEQIHAPDVQELLEQLPTGVELYKERDDETKGKYGAVLDPRDAEEIEKERYSSNAFYDVNPAEALALLWLDLKERGLL